MALKDDAERGTSNKGRGHCHYMIIEKQTKKNIYTVSMDGD